MIILRIIFDSHFIHIKKKNSIHIICTICIFASIISTVIFVGKVSNYKSIYNSNNDYCTIHSHKEACTIAISQVLVQASLDHHYVKYVPTVF